MTKLAETLVIQHASVLPSVLSVKRCGINAPKPEYRLICAALGHTQGRMRAAAYQGQVQATAVDADHHGQPSGAQVCIYQSQTAQNFLRQLLNATRARPTPATLIDNHILTWKLIISDQFLLLVFARVSN